MIKEDDFSNRLKQYMELNSLTYDTLAKMTGYPAQTLNRYVLGKRTPKIDDFSKICESLGVNPLWLHGYDQPMYLEYINNEVHQLGVYDLSDVRLHEIIEIYNEMNDEGKEKLQIYAEDLKANPRHKKEIKYRLDTQKKNA